MRQELHLYLGEREIEFSQPPELLYNYTENDLKNPSVIKNSYSKTLTIEGTPSNNQIFGHFWDLERIQDYGNGIYTGSYFNPLQKADFQLFLNGEIYESGYFKLDKVTKTGNNITYEITLYGGLGSFFYNLTYSHAEGEVTGPDKLTLADLDYSTDDMDEPTLDFKITKEAVNKAWNTIIGEGESDNRFKIINFVPAYNGKPKDFKSNKVLISNNGYQAKNGTKFMPTSVDESGTIYQTYNPKTGTLAAGQGYSMGETSEELTEWEANNDLRSYNQRPAIRMKSIIQACCNPVNNMGYEVKLDDTFFNSNNPYYEDSWLTMPLLKDLDFESTTETVKSATIGAPAKSIYYITPGGTSPFSTYNNLEVGLTLQFTPSSTCNVNTLYTNYYNYYNSNTHYYDIKQEKTAGVILLQLVAFNEVGEVVSQSNLHYLYSKPASDSDYYAPDFDTFKEVWFGNNWNGPVPQVDMHIGKFVKDASGKYVWTNAFNQTEAFKFSLNSNTNFYRVGVRMMTLRNTRYDTQNHEFLSWGKSTDGPSVSVLNGLYNPDYVSKKGGTETPDAGKYTGNFSIKLDDNAISLVATKMDGMFSGTKITKKQLLSTDKTPCDYLLSYCKQFGLYFYKDANEVASNTSKYPKGVIHIMTRNSFYDITNVVNLEKYIDRSKEMTITPQVASTKWYDWGLNVEESEAEKDYYKANNLKFGTHRLNTGYNFDANKTEVFKDNAYKGGIMVLERDKYFQYPDQARYEEAAVQNYNMMYKVPTYAYNGMTISLYAFDGTERKDTEVETEIKTLPTNRSINTDYQGYDMYPKLQFHKEKNEATDGSGVLVFYRHEIPYWYDDSAVYGKVDYWLTDDLDAMVELNDSEACWIATNSETDVNGDKIAIKRSTIPYFSRTIDYQSTGKITHTWDIGKSQGFVPFLYETDGMSIYDKVWKKYASDIYSVNSKLLTCYCLLENRPNPEWLRRFYWFDNSIWRLNRIIDWNVSSYETTKMEFIKVQSLDNYTFNDITSSGEFTIALNASTIGADGGTVTGYMYAQDMGAVWLSDNMSLTYDDGTVEYLLAEDYITPRTGSGYVNFNFNVPANTSTMDRIIRISLAKEVAYPIVYTTIRQSGAVQAETGGSSTGGSTDSGNSGSTDSGDDVITPTTPNKDPIIEGGGSDLPQDDRYV